MSQLSSLSMALTIFTTSSLHGESEAPLLEIQINKATRFPTAELSFHAEADCFYLIERSFDGEDWFPLEVVMGEGETYVLNDPLTPETVLYRVSE